MQIYLHLDKDTPKEYANSYNTSFSCGSHIVVFSYKAVHYCRTLCTIELLLLLVHMCCATVSYRRHLTDERVIGRHFPILWPPGSSDLSLALSFSQKLCLSRQYYKFVKVVTTCRYIRYISVDMIRVAV